MRSMVEGCRPARDTNPYRQSHARFTTLPAMLHGPRPTQRRARALRRSLTLPEVLLWQALRQRPGEFRFRRQHPAGAYVLDFFCPAVGLAVEVDGRAHDNAAAFAHDAVRDAWLRRQGVTVMRVPAADVLGDCDIVVGRILQVAQGLRAGR